MWQDPLSSLNGSNTDLVCPPTTNPFINLEPYWFEVFFCLGGVKIKRMSSRPPSRDLIGDRAIRKEVPDDVQEAQSSREHMDVRSDPARHDMLLIFAW